MQINKFIIISAYVLIIWGIFDILLKINIYGVGRVDFLWFCSVALFVLGFGILLRSAMLLNTFLSIALLVQPLWMLDYIWISFFGVPLNGFSSFVFQPSFGVLEFVNNFRHMFMIPLGFYAVFMFSRKDRKSYFFIFLFLLSVLGITYILAPPQLNINCVNSSCVGDIGLTGFSYFIVFVLAVISLSLGINFFINMLLKKFEAFRKTEVYRRTISVIFILFMVISSVSIVAASMRYAQIPKYSCLGAEDCVDCTIDLECNYFYGEGENWTLVYTLGNKGDVGYVCETYMQILPIDEKFKKIAENYYIGPSKRYKIHQPLEYYGVDSQIKLISDCSVYELFV
jgi:hypothetical protein